MSVSFSITFVIGWLSLCCVCFAGLVKRSTAPTGNDDTAIRTELVDGNNRKQILAMFNLTEAQMSRIYAGLNAGNKESDTNGSIYFKNLRDFRINDIKTRISNAIQTKNSEEVIQHPLHEMAAYPTCNSETTETSWLQDNNITIQFSSTLFESKMQNLNLDSAILRLYKINPNETLDDAATDDGDEASNDDAGDTNKPKRCTTPQLDSQIRVTVSIVQQLRRNKRGVYERKKRICNTIMMNVSSTGWVEIDIRRAIYIWENVGKQMEQAHQQQARPPVLVGWLMIEVHDEEEQPLKPGLYFKPPSCNQADLAIPWNYYRPDPAMSPFASHNVPRFPRLDVKLIGYASFAPINMPNAQPDTVYASLKSKLFNLSQQSSSSSEIDNESTTQTSSTSDHNHLQEVDDAKFDDNDMQQRLQQKRQMNLHHAAKDVMMADEQEMEIDEEEKMPRENIEYNYRNHPRHYRHLEGQQNKHHHNHHHSHEQPHDFDDNDDKREDSDAVILNNNEDHRVFKRLHPRYHHSSVEVPAEEDVLEKNIEQQQHETKLLEHIVHKLAQEEKQLILLHQQQQQEQQDQHHIEQKEKDEQELEQ